MKKKIKSSGKILKTSSREIRIKKCRKVTLRKSNLLQIIMYLSAENSMPVSKRGKTFIKSIKKMLDYMFNWVNSKSFYLHLSSLFCCYRLPSVYTVDKLKAEYSKAKQMKNRISKSKRALAGVWLPNNSV